MKSAGGECGTHKILVCCHLLFTFARTDPIEYRPNADGKQTSQRSTLPAATVQPT